MKEVVDIGSWALLPPLISIGVAMLTREIVISLFLGVFSGASLYAFASGGAFLKAADTILSVLSTRIGENMPMVIFLLLLGALVAVVNVAGGAKAYGEWAFRHLKSARSASLMTCVMGIIIFIDDYFNCLTVGSVMRPVTDRFKVSREKLAYFIDATAAPVCIMAPISSWAAYVISCMPADARVNGMSLFIQAIPANFYAILTLVMVGWVAIRKNSDYGLMRRFENVAHSGHVIATEKVTRESIDRVTVLGNGHVCDLVLPIVALVIFSFLSLAYYGGYWKAGANISLLQALGETDPGRSLSVSALAAILVSFLLLVPRRILTFHQFSAALLTGFKTMVPALVMLSLAWGLSGVCNDLLGTGRQISRLVCAIGMEGAFLPAICFLLAAFFAFSTGASWAVIGIITPVVFEICRAMDPSISVLALSASLAGAVMGDHCSPIADTTILSSAGAGCRHMTHIATQMPYAFTAGIISFCAYLIAGYTWRFGFGVSVMTSIVFSLAVLATLFVWLEHRQLIHAAHRKHEDRLRTISQ